MMFDICLIYLVGGDICMGYLWDKYGIYMGLYEISTYMEKISIGDWNMTLYIFPYIGNNQSFQLTNIFQRG